MWWRRTGSSSFPRKRESSGVGRRRAPAFAGPHAARNTLAAVAASLALRRWAPAFAGAHDARRILAAVAASLPWRRWAPAFAGAHDARRILAAVAASLLLASCGFQLRGSTALPFATLW